MISIKMKVKEDLALLVVNSRNSSSRKVDIGLHSQLPYMWGWVGGDGMTHTEWAQYEMGK